MYHRDIYKVDSLLGRPQREMGIIGMAWGNAFLEDWSKYFCWALTNLFQWEDAGESGIHDYCAA